MISIAKNLPLKNVMSLRNVVGNNALNMNTHRRRYLADKIRPKVQGRRNMTRLVGMYRRGANAQRITMIRNPTNNERRNHRELLNHLESIRRPNAKEQAIYTYFLNIPHGNRRQLTNRNIGKIFLAATPAQLRAFLRIPRRSTLGRKLIV